jgi:hypothetical protein
MRSIGVLPMKRSCGVAAALRPRAANGSIAAASMPVIRPRPVGRFSSGSVPERLLARYQGYLQTDGYEGYAAPRCQGSCRLITFT